MAEGQNQQAAGGGGGKGKPSPKLLAVVGGIMLLEAAGVYVGVTMMGAPKPAQAGLEGAVEAEHEKTVEVPLIHEQYQNVRGGRPWRWEVEVLLQVRQKNLDAVNAMVERRDAELREGIGMIFRGAQARHLEEPELATLRRQLAAYLNEIFGTDGEGLPRVERVLVPTCKGSPGDF